MRGGGSFVQSAVSGKAEAGQSVDRCNQRGVHEVRVHIGSAAEIVARDSIVGIGGENELNDLPRLRPDKDATTQ